MANVLPGYTYDKGTNRYRNEGTGQFVSRADINSLVEEQVNGSEQRMNDLGSSYQSGELAASVYVEAMKQELKRTHLQQAALAKGGFDRLDQSDYGRTGQALQQLYPKIVGTAEDIANGEVSEAQLAQRNTAYAGSARTLYHRTETANREEEIDEIWIAKRSLDPTAQHCADCVSYAALGWQPEETLPEPGEACACGGNCRCSKQSKKIKTSELDSYLGESARDEDENDMGLEQFKEVDETEIIPNLVERAVRRDGTIPVKVINPGWGSSGYYSPEVLERDGPNVFRSGTQMFWDHQTLTEEADRPEGSLNNLAAVLVSDSRWEPNGADGPGLYADAKVFSGYKEAIEELAPHIGVSIRASGNRKLGEAAGRKGFIVESIDSAKSIDFVTRPGAGGKVLEMFESARPNITESAQPTGEDNRMSEELRESVEKANADLKEAQERIAEQNALISQMNKALLIREAREYVADELAESGLPEATRKRLVRALSAEYPLTESGELDTAAYGPIVADAIKEAKAELDAYLQESGGRNARITGMGTSQSNGNTQEPVPEAIQKRMNEAYRRMGLSESEAANAARGRDRLY